MSIWDWVTDIGIGDVVKAGVNIGGALLSNDATNKAIDTQTAAGDKALALQKEMYDQSRQDLAPYRESGNAANAKLSQLMGLAKPDSAAIKANFLKSHPALFGGAVAEAAPAAATGGWGNADAQEVNLRRLFETDPNDMSAAAKMKRLKGYQLNTALQNFKDGDINPTTGEKFNRKQFLDFLQNEADFEVSRPRSTLGFQPMTAEEAAPINAERETLYRQTYIPSKSKQGFSGFISNTLAPVIAGGLLAAPLAGAMAGLGGAAMPASHGVGMLANRLGSTVVSNIGSNLAKGVK